LRHQRASACVTPIATRSLQNLSRRGDLVLKVNQIKYEARFHRFWHCPANIIKFIKD
jgi:hypothetical protein